MKKFSKWYSTVLKMSFSYSSSNSRVTFVVEPKFNLLGIHNSYQNAAFALTISEEHWADEKAASTVVYMLEFTPQIESVFEKKGARVKKLQFYVDNCAE